MIKSQEFFSKSRDFDSHRRKLVTSFCPLFFILNQLSHRLEHNLAVDNLMKPSVILKFHRGNTIPHGLEKVNGKRKNNKFHDFTHAPWRMAVCSLRAYHELNVDPRRDRCASPFTPTSSASMCYLVIWATYIGFEPLIHHWWSVQFRIAACVYYSKNIWLMAESQISLLYRCWIGLEPHQPIWLLLICRFDTTPLRLHARLLYLS